eukprot:scaffold24058_cov61-Phaeocystis_antarctica.AAC.6
MGLAPARARACGRWAPTVHKGRGYAAGVARPRPSSWSRAALVAHRAAPALRGRRQRPHPLMESTSRAGLARRTACHRSGAVHCPRNSARTHHGASAALGRARHRRGATRRRRRRRAAAWRSERAGGAGAGLGQSRDGRGGS